MCKLASLFLSKPRVQILKKHHEIVGELLNYDNEL